MNSGKCWSFRGTRQVEYGIYYRINTYFNIFQNDYKIYAEECYTKNIIPWINNNLTSNNTSMITNVSKTNIGDYWIKIVVEFTWKNIIR